VLLLTGQGPTADPLPRRHLHDAGLGCSRFARRYCGNHSLFSLPEGTEMFHFPSFAPSALWIRAEVPRLFAAVGFPIRTSPDQRLVGSSPELCAATHVLHRLSAPRHPPYALSSLLTSISRPPASRRFFKTRDQGPGPRSSRRALEVCDAPEERPALPRVPPPGLDTQLKLNSTLRMQLSKSSGGETSGPKCGADRDRTDDFQLAKLALSQLSYSPVPDQRPGPGGTRPTVFC
jgi:hypothetical protein